MRRVISCQGCCPTCHSSYLHLPGICTSYPRDLRYRLKLGEEFFTNTQFSMKAGSTDPLNCEMSLVCFLKTANSRTMRSARDKTVT